MILKNKNSVPTSAHGTNPASTAVCGFDIIEVPSLDNGRVDVKALRSLIDESLV